MPLLVGALAAIDCEVEEIVERHSHAIVIGRVLDVAVSARTAALAYWQGQYVAIDRDEDALRLAEVSLPASRATRKTCAVVARSSGVFRWPERAGLSSAGILEVVR